MNAALDEPDGFADDAVVVAPGVALRAGSLAFSFSRGGGPGGQNVNKVNTHATLTVALGDIEKVLPPWAMDRLRAGAGRYLADDPPRLVIHASDSRSQLANRRSCVMKLRGVLVEALSRPRKRRATKPSRAAVQRRIDEKKHRSQIKSKRQSPTD